MIKLTQGGKKLMTTLVVGGLLFGGYIFLDSKGKLPSKLSVGAIIAKKVDLPKAAPLSNITNVPMAPLPSDSVIGTGEEVRMMQMGWSSQLGINYANGGKATTKGSLMEKNGITNFKIIREDNCDNQVNALVAFGEAFKRGGGNPQKGAQVISFMLDGTPSYMLALKNGLEPLGLHAKIIASVGKSNGEDSFFGPAAWKKDPSKMKGAIVIGVLYDGDMNIAIKFAQDNGIRINPDTKTYDPDALNIVAAEDYLKAVDMLRDGVTETRTNTRTGKPIEITTDKKKKKVVGGPELVDAGVVTWTPGDVRVATEIGDLVPLMTTADNYWQMPQAFIVIKEWADANPKLVKGILKGAFEGGAQVKVHDKALYKACEISAKAWTTKASPKDEQDPKYWYKNFKAHEIADKAGKQVMVGGSMNFSIEDNIVAFGIERGDGGPAKSSYTIFGDEMARLWPKKLAAYPAFDEAFDPTFIIAVAKEMTLNQDLTQKPEYSGKPVTQTLASTALNIQFDTGKASLTPAGLKTCQKLFNSVNINNLVITIAGHTDKHGTPQGNMALSKARAESVVRYLVSKGLPENKFRVEYYGDTQPIGSDDAANRRVVIELNK